MPVSDKCLSTSTYIHGTTLPSQLNSTNAQEYHFSTMAHSRRHASIIIGQDRIVIALIRDQQQDHVWHVQEQTYDLRSGALIYVGKSPSANTRGIIQWWTNPDQNRWETFRAICQQTSMRILSYANMKGKDFLPGICGHGGDRNRGRSWLFLGSRVSTAS